MCRSNRTNGTLQGFYTFNDADMDTETDKETKWYNNSAEVISLRNTTTIGSGNTTKGQMWIFSVRVYDSEHWSNWINSTELTIQNTAPTHAMPILNSSSETNTTSEDLTCYNQSTSDIDNDIVINKIRWFNNSIAIPTLENQTTISSGNTTKTEVWLCEITPIDDDSYGTPLNSSQLTILNTPPVATNIILNSTDAALNRTNGTLTASWDFSDSDGDTQTDNETKFLENWAFFFICIKIN